MAQKWADKLAKRRDCSVEHNQMPPGHAENMAECKGCPTITGKETVRQWKKSPGHNRNVSKVKKTHQNVSSLSQELVMLTQFFKDW